MIYDQYRNEALQSFVEKQLEVYYNSIELLCIDAQKQTEKLIKLENRTGTSQYTSLCDKIITETEEYVRTWREKHLPYITKLSEKATANHDCSNCSGNCNLNHEMTILEMNAGNEGMQNMLNKLQIASLPLYSETLYPHEHRLLHNYMTLIETAVTELLFLGNHYLLPKIIEAQKNIHASS